MLFNSFSENLNSFQETSLRGVSFYLGKYEKFYNETEDFLRILPICK